MKRVWCSMLAVMMIAGAAGTARAGDSMPARDRDVIGRLLDRLRERKDLKFVRQEKVYDARAAAWYLKYKWDHNKEKVHSVADFINLSSYGGEHGEITYYVEFSDGTKKPAKEVLEESVKKLESKEK